jgi:raffinose/stachyose/melibiose transport system permease protein
MSQQVTDPVRTGRVRPSTGAVRRSRARVLPRKLVTSFFALVWAIVVVAPLYYMLVVSIQAPNEFMDGNPWVPSGDITLDNYRGVLDSG